MRKYSERKGTSMESDLDIRFRTLAKRKVKYRLWFKRIFPEFQNSSDEAKKLFLEVNENRMYSYDKHSMADFEQLVALGYTCLQELNNARIDYSSIIAFNLKKEYLPLLRKTLRHDLKPNAELLEYLKHDDRDGLDSFEHRTNSFYYARELNKVNSLS